MGLLLELAHVLIVVIGDSTWEDGYASRGELPTFQELRARGATFTRWISCPIGSQSMYELYFGEYPERNGSTSGFNWYTDDLGPSGVPSPDVPHDKPSLPEAFQRAGYATALFGKWGLGGNRIEPETQETRGRTPSLHGFDRWLAGIGANVSSVSEVPNKGRGFAQWERWDDGAFSGIERRWADQAIGEAWRRWWRETEGPRFSVVWFEAGHGPWNEAPPRATLPDDYRVRAGNRRGRYKAMLQAVDFQLGRMLAEVDLERTYVLVFTCAGTPDTEGIARGGDESRSKRSVYERGIRCPAVLLGPGVEAGASDERLVAPKDVWARLTALPDVPLEGPPGPDSRTESELVYRHILGQRAVRGADVKLVEHEDGTQELFDLAADPEERAPIDPDAYEDRALVERLRAVLAKP